MEAVVSNFHEFVVTLKGYCETGINGCLFFTSSANAAGRIVLADGEIIDIAYSHKKGNDAIVAMHSIEQVKYRLDEGTTNSIMKDGSLPATDVIIRNLTAMPAGTQAESKPTNAQAAASGTILTAKISKDIEECLIEVIGPMASFICEDYVYNAKTLEQAMVDVLNELDSSEGQQFKSLFNMKQSD